MRIEVTNANSGWKPKDADSTFKPIYTIAITGQGEMQKTMDSELAKIGIHDAEQYQVSSGKTYWRKVTNPTDVKPDPSPTSRQFVADPVKQESIEWQTALKVAAEVVRDYYTLKSNTVPVTLALYKQDVVDTIVTLTRTIEIKPETLTYREPNIQDVVNDTEPPIENYEDMVTEDVVDILEDEINLDDIPF